MYHNQDSPRRNNNRNNDYSNNRGGNYGGNDRGYDRSSRGSNDRGRGRGGFRGGRGGGAPRRDYQSKPHCLSGEGAIFPIKIAPGSKAYRFDVDMVYKFEKINRDKQKEVSEMKLTSDKRDNRTRQLCYIIISIVMEETHNFGLKDVEVAYDNQATMYANKRFTPVIQSIDKGELPDEYALKLPNDGTIHITIKPNEEQPEIDLSDYSQYEARELLLTEDQTLRQVLEIILSQGAINSGDYSVVGNGQLFHKREESIERGICTRVGSHKGIRMIDIETKEKGRTVKHIQPAVILDFKRSPFFCEGRFLDAILNFVEQTPEGRSEQEKWKIAEQTFKGIKLCPLYNRGRALRFTAFTTKKVSEMRIKLDDGADISLVDFYARMKKCRLEYPNLRAATCGRDGDFPLELLKILPDQRVDLQYVPTKIRDMVHKKNAVDPQIRYDNIMEEFDRLSFNNEVTKGFGISIDTNPLEKGGTILTFNRPDKPEIQVGGNKILRPSEEGKFNIAYDKYLIPCDIQKWAILMAPSVDQNLAEHFKNKFVDYASQRGCRISSNAKFVRIDTSKKQKIFDVWNAQFTHLKRDGCQYILLIDVRNNTSSHGLLKLMESMHKIVTQHVNYETLQNIIQRNQNVTLGNILMKTNVKNGGTNYKPLFNQKASRLDINEGKVLVIGYDISHPTGVNPEERNQRLKDGMESETKDPSIVGITSNSGVDPSCFIGDFFFQATRKETVDREELKLYMKRILEQVLKNRSKQPGFKMPETIIILRDGISEGQFKMSCEDELPALKDGCFAFSQNYKPKFIFIVATKRHHKRFFEGEHGKFENPVAGSFVENNVVRPDCIEFFMASHKTIKGTTKFVQVSVICNDLGATRDEIKNFLHSLCYGHQIVCSPTSLPTPIYIADELATRGSEVYKALKEYYPTHIPWKDNEVNYLELTHMLNYSESKLANIRFNA